MKNHTHSTFRLRGRRHARTHLCTRASAPCSRQLPLNLRARAATFSQVRKGSLLPHTSPFLVVDAHDRRERLAAFGARAEPLLCCLGGVALLAQCAMATRHKGVCVWCGHADDALVALFERAQQAAVADSSLTHPFAVAADLQHMRRVRGNGLRCRGPLHMNMMIEDRSMVVGSGGGDRLHCGTVSKVGLGRGRG